MATRIMCTPHDRRGKPVYGRRYQFSVRVISDGPDGEEIHEGEFDLCEADARPLIAAIEYVTRMNLAKQAEAPPHGPLFRREPKRRDEPQADDEAPDMWVCDLCVETVHSKQRGHHAYSHHKRVWEIDWQPLFDASDWQRCSCGHRVKTSAGLRQHIQEAGPEHRQSLLKPVRDEELTPAPARALLRAVEDKNPR